MRSTFGRVQDHGAARGEPRSIGVLIADDHPVYIDGLAGAIKRADDLELVATCRNGAEALERIRTEAPDVAVLDLRMPRLDAAGILGALAEEGTACRVLVLSFHVGGEAVHECLSLGAAGYIPKDADRAEICDAIRAIAAGRTVLSSEAQAAMATELAQRRSAPPSLLSARESEVLSMLASGASAPDIAAQLHLSTATVKTHLHNLYEKLGVSDRAAAVAEGMRRGLIR
jgi:two-component system, NarL family, nitrate/nitrite response regulator NarL